MIQYAIIQADSIAELEVLVNDRINQGWELQGGVGARPFNGFVFMQAMIQKY